MLSIRSRPARRGAILLGLFAGLLAPVVQVEAGVTNPNISVIGQPFLRFSDDPADPDRNRVRLDAGETEFVFDAALNPYANGVFTVSLAPGEGVDLEEGYFVLVRGLPLSLGLKGGKYRAGFGRLNPLHPHAYPFAERPRVLAAYLPGEESFNETGISLSRLFAVGDNLAVTAAADWLQGNSFHPAVEGDSLGIQEETRPAFLGRVSGFRMLGEQSALEFGFSGTRGRTDVRDGLDATILGTDLKAKLWTSPRSYLVLQAEGLRLSRQALDPDPCPECDRLGPDEVGYGGYIFADYNWATRYNAGGLYEQYENPASGGTDRAYGLFAGLALLEETTAFRADWNHFRPEGGDPVNTFTLRVIYSMGPHKAHQF